MHGVLNRCTGPTGSSCDGEPSERSSLPSSPSRSLSPTIRGSDFGGPSHHSFGSHHSSSGHSGGQFGRCQYKEWLDGPWPIRVQAAFKKLWSELKLWRHVESQANEHLMELLDSSKASKKEKEEKEKEKLMDQIDNTKRATERLYGTFRRKAAYALVDKSKLMYLVYCLLGVIAFQFALIFLVPKK